MEGLLLAVVAVVLVIYVMSTVLNRWCNFEGLKKEICIKQPPIAIEYISFLPQLRFFQPNISITIYNRVTIYDIKETPRKEGEISEIDIPRDTYETNIL